MMKQCAAHTCPYVSVRVRECRCACIMMMPGVCATTSSEGRKASVASVATFAGHVTQVF
jgi:hypothetical protein